MRNLLWGTEWFTPDVMEEGMPGIQIRGVKHQNMQGIP